MNCDKVSQGQLFHSRLNIHTIAQNTIKSYK